MSKTTIIEGREYNKAKVRKDLLEEQVAVPVGKNYYSSPEPLPYRWKDDGDEEFEIFINGKWHLSESIDWEFEG